MEDTMRGSSPSMKYIPSMGCPMGLVACHGIYSWDGPCDTTHPWDALWEDYRGPEGNPWAFPWKFPWDASYPMGYPVGRPMGWVAAHDKCPLEDPLVTLRSMGRPMGCPMGRDIYLVGCPIGRPMIIQKRYTVDTPI